MCNINKRGRYPLISFLVCSISICVCRVQVQASGTIENPNVSVQSSKPDGFKTTFEGDLISLDLNCKKGYDKFECLIENTKVTYQSKSQFQEVKDGNTEIWKSGDQKAFRALVQFFGPKPKTVAIELDPHDPSKCLYYLKKYNSDEWEKSDAKTHDKRVQDLLKAIQDFKETVKQYDEKAVDLDLTVKNSEFSFKIHNYKGKDEKLSQNKNNLTPDLNKVKTLVEGSYKEPNAETSELKLPMKPEHRIVKLVYNPCPLRKNVTVWETGGGYYCVNVEGERDGTFYDTFTVDVISKETYQKFRFKFDNVSGGSCFCTSIDFKQSEKVELEPFDFKYDN